MEGLIMLGSPKAIPPLEAYLKSPASPTYRNLRSFVELALKRLRKEQEK